MNKKTIITALLALVTLSGQAQEERAYDISGFVPDGIEKKDYRTACSSTVQPLLMENLQ